MLIMHFIFIDSNFSKLFNLSTPATEGIGGIQSAICYYAESLVKKGHEVIILNSTTEEFIDMGVQFKPRKWFFNQTRFKTDVIILCSGITLSYVDSLHKFDYKLFVLWEGHPHSETAITNIEKCLYNIDLFAFVSERQRNKYLDTFNIPFQKTGIMANGLNKAFDVELDSSLKEKRLIYFVAPERGLEHFLEIWPKIYKNHPDAYLDIFSSRKNYGVRDLKKIIELKEKLALMPNVSVNSSIGQKELHDQCQKAAIFSYPNTCDETFCMCLFEARAAGCFPITSDIGIMPTLISHCVEYDKHFIENYAKYVCDTLDLFSKRRAEFNEIIEHDSTYIRQNFNYDKLVDVFLELIKSRINEKEKSIKKQKEYLSLPLATVNSYESLPLYFQSTLDAANFFLKMGILYYNSNLSHMCEKYFLKSWQIKRTIESGKNLFIYHTEQKSYENMVEWYFKCCLISNATHDMKIKLIDTVPSSYLSPFKNIIKPSSFFKDRYLIKYSPTTPTLEIIENETGLETFKLHKINFSIKDVNSYAQLKKIEYISSVENDKLYNILKNLNLWEHLFITSASSNEWYLIHDNESKSIDVDKAVMNAPMDSLLLIFEAESGKEKGGKWINHAKTDICYLKTYAIHSSFLLQLMELSLSSNIVENANVYKFD